MLIELVRKEIIEQRSGSKQSKTSAILKALIKLVLYAALVVVECFIFTSLDKKITDYSSYGTYDFLVIFVFAFFVIGLVSALLSERKVLFSSSDNKITLTLPIPHELIVFSKVVYTYIKQVSLQLLTATPIMICFGAARNNIPYFYIFCLLYPLIISALIIGISLIFAPLAEYIYKLIKANTVIQFILSVVVVIGLCFIYQEVLTLFLSALNNSSTGGMFSQGFIDFIHSAVIYFVPINNLLEIAVLNSNVLPNMCIFLGLLLITLVLGISLSSHYYRVFNMNEIKFESRRYKNKTPKVMSPLMALLRKEITLLFRDSGYMFSYSALLIMAPFLAFVVVSSLNNIIYKNLVIFSSYFPELINGLNISLILLFSTVINSSATLSMSREGKAIQIVKYIPVKPRLQLFAKVVMPIILSGFSLLITTLILLFTNCISLKAFFVTLFLGLVLIVATNLLGIYFDMHDKTPSKVKYSSFNTVISLGIPAIILATHLVLSLSAVNPTIIYVVEIIEGLIILPVSIIITKKKYHKAFREMEAK